VTVQASGFSGTLALSFDSVRRVARGSSIVRQVQSTAARSTTGQ